MSANRGIAVPLSIAAVLLAAGLALIVPGSGGHEPHPTAAPSSAVPHPPAPQAPGQPPSPPGTPFAAPTTAASSPPGPAAGPSAVPSGIPAAGDGPQGDPAIQDALTTRYPSDLPAADSARLVELARAVWAAEATGEGQERWPSYFPAAQRGSGRGYFFTGFRVQAAAAHSVDGNPDRATVALLWAGTSPAGEYGDHRPAAVGFARVSGSWEPQR
ncbi:hypothetical protein [Kitasatospora griseola]|uniref:hypothetical protein n=1 Tax=Kitasatospora griseola TaxID=2064 RepID=UPI0034240D96